MHPRISEAPSVLLLCNWAFCVLQSALNGDKNGNGSPAATKIQPVVDYSGPVPHTSVLTLSIQVWLSSATGLCINQSTENCWSQLAGHLQTLFPWPWDKIIFDSSNHSHKLRSCSGQRLWAEPQHLGTVTAPSPLYLHSRIVYSQTSNGLKEKMSVMWQKSMGMDVTCSSMMPGSRFFLLSQTN